MAKCERVLEQWERWQAYYQENKPIPPPCRVLAENVHLLPTQGRALDLACGFGANALLLARHGLTVEAWDYAPSAIERLQDFPVQAKVRDVLAEPPSAHSFHVIVICHFLERQLMPRALDALLPGGLLFYQTFTQTKIEGGAGPRNPNYRLSRNELLNICRELSLVVYREEDIIGDLQRGFRQEAMLIGQKMG